MNCHRLIVISVWSLSRLPACGAGAVQHPPWVGSGQRCGSTNQM